jgi:preprotein translocase subunit SecD
MARPLHEKGAIKPLAKAFPAKSISAIAKYAIRQQYPSLNNRLDNPVLWRPFARRKRTDRIPSAGGSTTDGTNETDGARKNELLPIRAHPRYPWLTIDSIRVGNA